MNKKISLIALGLGIILIITGAMIELANEKNTPPPKQNKYEETKEVIEQKKDNIAAIEDYITSVMNSVNNMDYNFVKEKTVFAIPVDCIKITNEYKNLIGKWSPVTYEYWAYVLVYYDDSISSYIYGFTFKDSAGYGMYPTDIQKLDKSGTQIKMGLIANRPSNGELFLTTALINWNDFKTDLTDEYRLEVLEPSEIGDNITTCTIAK